MQLCIQHTLQVSSVADRLQQVREQNLRLGGRNFSLFSTWLQNSQRYVPSGRSSGCCASWAGAGGGRGGRGGEGEGGEGGEGGGGRGRERVRGVSLTLHCSVHRVSVSSSASFPIQVLTFLLPRLRGGCGGRLAVVFWYEGQSAILHKRQLISHTHTATNQALLYRPHLPQPPNPPTCPYSS